MHRIRQLRDEFGWTQEYLGAMVNMSKSVISKYESERSALSAPTIIKIASVFNVSTDYLLGVSEYRTGFESGISVQTDELSVLDSDDYTVVETNISEDEKILQYYNRLNDENKDDIKGQMVRLFKEQSNPFSQL